ncbi:hypothetical protein [Piscinibacter sp. HJYY11]|uniref:hypothetical protein n=1 Tax=Piscinibacter sp. HJYY11 TaxID=2801333 RepID=UPI00191E5F4F|nr:hypothetical protein [Piscinibacter sp. HJYY11]MBL0726078.1 hypothetical protein [Piscinibacter sp. HJYY11]
MQNFILRPGPALMAQRWVKDGDEDLSERVDVSMRAHQHLFETVELDACVTLADVLGLLAKDATLRQVFHRDWSEEICAEAQLGAFPLSSREPSLNERMEYLELYQQWGYDSSRRTYLPTQRLQLHGLGAELEDDAPAYGRKKGERIAWSISLTPVRELLTLPIRVCPGVIVVEDDVDSRSYGLEIGRVFHPDVTLGQIVDGVLNELGFHGGPAQRDALAEELGRRAQEATDGPAELVSIDDLFKESVQPACDAMFDDLGGRTSREIQKAMRLIADDENAANWFHRTFDGAVVVKAQFRNRTGREFRKAFRAANR